MSVDIHALSGAYAVDAVDDLERARFERHLAECETCCAEVDSLQEAGALLAATAAVTPRAGLRAEVLTAVAAVRPLPPVLMAAAHRGRSTRRRFPALVAAAAALIAVGAVGATVLPDESPDRGSEQAGLSPTERVLQADDAEKVSKSLPDGGTMTVVRSMSLDQAVVVADDVADPPTGHTYELWLEQDGDYLPVGAIAGGDTTKLISGDTATSAGVGVTVELAGDEPTEPSTPLYQRIPFEQA